jgi:hypothetical protein
MSSRKNKEVWLELRIGFANHLTLIVCFIYYKKWVQRENCLFKTRLPYGNKVPRQDYANVS